jgi:hypothetical protein
MTAAELNPELRNLIDARLDAIDQALVRAQVPWSERRSIVGEVETQVFELLGRRGALPVLEDVLAVLASLDPPESYIPEELRGAPADAAAPAANPPRQPRWQLVPLRTVQRIGQWGLCAVALVILNGIVIAIIAASDGVVPWLVTLGVLAWLNYTGVRTFRTWSANHRGHLVDSLRYSLGAWLMPKDGVRAT